MKNVYLTKNGISMKVLDRHVFKKFNWRNFEKGELVFVNDEYFADFVSYERNSRGAEIVKLELN